MFAELRIPWAALALAAVLALGGEGVAFAQEPQFGDSTWVAPYSLADFETPDTPGPRVAERDRTRTGETILRTPFRLVGVPIRLLADGLGIGAGLVLLPYVSQWSVYPIIDYGTTPGLVGGIGFRSPKSDTTGWTGNLTAALSTNDHRRLGLEQRIGDRKAPLVRIDSQYRHRPNLPFYGIGNSSDDERFIYLEEEGLVDAFLFFGSDPLKQARLLGGFSQIAARRGSDSSPSIEEGFDVSEVPFFLEKSSVVSYGVGADLAFLNRPAVATRGAHARVEARRFHGVDDTDLDYMQWHIEGRGYIPFFAERRAIALRAVHQIVDPLDDSRPVPFYRLPGSTGETLFSAFANERFRDRQLLLAHLEYRWQIWDYAWAYLFTQWGAVAPTASQFRYADGHESHGGGFRFGGLDGFGAYLEFANGSEGIRMRFKGGTF